MELLKADFIHHAFPKHTHDGYVVGVIERGAEAFECRGSLCVAPVGSIVVVNPGEVHNGYSYGVNGWSYRTFYPSIGLVRKIAGELNGGRGAYPVFRTPVIEDAKLAGLLKNLHITLEDSASALERETLFTETMSLFINRHSSTGATIPEPSNEPVSVARAKEYMESCYSENITLEQLSNLTGLNPFYFSRVFKKTTGLPPHAYLTQVRIKRAKLFLLKGESIADTALLAGFVDQSHFTRHFKRFTGVTPGQFVL